MASIGLASSDAKLLSDVTRGLSSAHEIHWLPLGDALARCQRRQIDVLIVDAESGSSNIEALRACVMQHRVPVIVVGRSSRGEEVARQVGGVFFARGDNVRSSDDAEDLEGARDSTLPETVWSLVLLDAMRTARQKNAPTSGRAPTHSHARGTILVVDDEDSICETLRALLEQEGYAVEIARDGEEALAALRGAKALPSLILLDLMMPRISGWEVREALRKDPKLATIPVAVISAAHPPPKAVGDWYLKKPIDVDELLRVVDGFLAAS